jgi:hypothetical protein
LCRRWAGRGRVGDEHRLRPGSTRTC